jgi:hypothetical protein
MNFTRSASTKYFLMVRSGAHTDQQLLRTDQLIKDDTSSGAFIHITN